MRGETRPDLGIDEVIRLLRTAVAYDKVIDIRVGDYRLSEVCEEAVEWLSQYADLRNS